MQIDDLVKQSRLVGIEFFEDGSHKRLADKSATVGHTVLIAKTIQGTLLVFVEKNGNPMFAWRFFCHNEIDEKIISQIYNYFFIRQNKMQL